MYVGGRENEKHSSHSKTRGGGAKMIKKNLSKIWKEDKQACGKWEIFWLTQKNLPRWLGNITGSGWKRSQVEAMLLKTAWAAWTNVERTQTRLQLKDPSNKNIQIYIWKQGGGSLTFKARWRKKDLRRKDAKAENKHREGSPSESTGNSPFFQMG